MTSAKFRLVNTSVLVPASRCHASVTLPSSTTCVGKGRPCIAVDLDFSAPFPPLKNRYTARKLQSVQCTIATDWLIS
jgi:hypothetical protein